MSVWRPCDLQHRRFCWQNNILPVYNRIRIVWIVENISFLNQRSSVKLFLSHDHITWRAHKAAEPRVSVLHLLVRWCWSSHYHYLLHWAVLRPAWGSLQLFRAIKLNKMEPRCDHSAHSDHIVTIVFLVFRAHDSAPHWPRVRTPHSSWPTPFISINILLATRIAQFWLLMNSNYAFVGPSTCFKLYIIHSYIWGKKYNI